MNPDQIVQLQVEAYNERDTEKFLSFYAETIQIYQSDSLIGEKTLLYQSIPEMRESYGKMFAGYPHLHAKIQKRIQQGNYVIDHEYVTGLNTDAPLLAIAIYEVRDDKIQAVWFLK